MIEIDILTDLAQVGADGKGRGQSNRWRPHIRPGALLVAGGLDRWSWVRVLEVDQQFVTFSLLSDEAAAKEPRVQPNTVRVEFPWPRIPWLSVEEYSHVGLDRNTYMWVDHIQFSLDPELDDRALLTALMSSRFYAHGYGSPYGFGGDAGFEGVPVHGPWLAKALTPEMFVLSTADEARRTIHGWMDEEVDTSMSARTHERVERLLNRTLEGGVVYRLTGPANVDREMWSYSGVSIEPFHEFVAIDRGRESMQLIVASDD
ncbi:hypothetical protein ACFWEJ_01850 [Promicromonospora sp. NPDC060204]|uniref:hypothetical protein n=1 Tax=Promicromonospora sp. NPDC060204 TaxID=3347071 RepID=UPI0036489BE3